MSSKPKIRNVVIECTEQPEVFEDLKTEYRRQPAEYRSENKYHISQHRIAKTALRVGLAVLKGKTPVEVRELMSELAPTQKRCWDEGAKKWL